MKTRVRSPSRWGVLVAAEHCIPMKDGPQGMQPRSVLEQHHSCSKVVAPELTYHMRPIQFFLVYFLDTQWIKLFESCPKLSLHHH